LRGTRDLEGFSCIHDGFVGTAGKCEHVGSGEERFGERGAVDATDKRIEFLHRLECRRQLRDVFLQGEGGYR